jgi:hypothetical protein
MQQLPSSHVNLKRMLTGDKVKMLGVIASEQYRTTAGALVAFVAARYPSTVISREPSVASVQHLLYADVLHEPTADTRQVGDTEFATMKRAVAYIKATAVLPGRRVASAASVYKEIAMVKYILRVACAMQHHRRLAAHSMAQELHNLYESVYSAFSTLVTLARLLRVWKIDACTDVFFSEPGDNLFVRVGRATLTLPQLRRGYQAACEQLRANLHGAVTECVSGAPIERVLRSISEAHTAARTEPAMMLQDVLARRNADAEHWQRVHDDALQRLAALLLVSGGGPWRGSEAVTLRCCDLHVLANHELASVVHYNKTDALRGRPQPLVRKYPARVGRLVLLLLAVVRPLCASAVRASAYVFCTATGAAWTAQHMRDAVARQLAGSLALPHVTMRVWRHMFAVLLQSMPKMSRASLAAGAQHATQAHLDGAVVEMAYYAQTRRAGHAQMGHSLRTGEQVYGGGVQAREVAHSDALHFSTMWHVVVLEESPGAMRASAGASRGASPATSPTLPLLARLQAAAETPPHQTLLHMLFNAAHVSHYAPELAHYSLNAMQLHAARLVASGTSLLLLQRAGAGKTLVAMLLARARSPKLTVVVHPLRAVLQQQLADMRETLGERAVAAWPAVDDCTWTVRAEADEDDAVPVERSDVVRSAAFQRVREEQRALAAELRRDLDRPYVLLCTPEQLRVDGPLWHALEVVAEQVAAVVVDEAHMLLGEFRRAAMDNVLQVLRSPLGGAQVLLMSGSMTVAQDVQLTRLVPTPVATLRGALVRPEVHVRVLPCAAEQRAATIHALLDAYVPAAEAGGRALVVVRTLAELHALTATLRRRPVGAVYECSSGRYAEFDRWLHGQHGAQRSVMVASSTLLAGVHLPDLALAVSVGAPYSTNDLLQLAGRTARGEHVHTGWCVVLLDAAPDAPTGDSVDDAQLREVLAEPCTCRRASLERLYGGLAQPADGAATPACRCDRCEPSWPARVTDMHVDVSTLESAQDELLADTLLPLDDVQHATRVVPSMQELDEVLRRVQHACAACLWAHLQKRVPFEPRTVAAHAAHSLPSTGDHALQQALHQAHAACKKCLGDHQAGRCPMHHYRRELTPGGANVCFKCGLRDHAFAACTDRDALLTVHTALTRRAAQPPDPTQVELLRGGQPIPNWAVTLLMQIKDLLR